MADSIYDYLTQDLYTRTPVSNPDGTSSMTMNGSTDQYASEGIVSGEIDGNLSYTGGFIQSKNFVSGSIGWRLSANGTLEAVNGIFSGAVNASSLTLKDSSGSNVLSGNTSGAASTFVLVVTPTSMVPSGIYINSAQNGYGMLIAQNNATTNFSPLQTTNAGLGGNLMINSNASSTTPALSLQNANGVIPVVSVLNSGTTGTGSHFTALFGLQGTTNVIWYSDGTTPNGNLTGVRGDLCINGSGGHLFWCSTSGTTWTQL